jgi:RecB family endonuclease NucS
MSEADTKMFEAGRRQGLVDASKQLLRVAKAYDGPYGGLIRGTADLWAAVIRAP